MASLCGAALRAGALPLGAGSSLALPSPVPPERFS